MVAKMKLDLIDFTMRVMLSGSIKMHQISTASSFLIKMARKYNRAALMKNPDAAMQELQEARKEYAAFMEKLPSAAFYVAEAPAMFDKLENEIKEKKSKV
jgi:hypothetical protein